MIRAMPRRKAALAAALVLLSLAFVPLVQGQDSAQTSAQIGQAYIAALNAEQSGGNVSALVAKLNTAVSLLQQANIINVTDPTRAQGLYANASALSQEVIQEAPSVASAGRASVAAAQLALAVETIVLLALAAFAYVYAPRIYWRFWLRSHRDWRVKKR